MDLLVEDGTGLAAANTYISPDYLIEYAVLTGQDLGAGDPAGAVIRASAYLDAQFGKDYPGSRVKGRGQGLGWPRTGALDAAGLAVAANEVPIEVRKATAEAALRETFETNSLMPDVAAGSALVKREKLGALETEYAVAAGGGRPMPPWFPKVDGILAPLLGNTDPFAPSWLWR